MTQPLRVLHLEDHTGDAAITRVRLDFAALRSIFVLPGDYFVGVLAGIAGDEHDDTALLEALGAASVSVSVIDGQTARVTLRIG